MTDRIAAAGARSPRCRAPTPPRLFYLGVVLTLLALSIPLARAQIPATTAYQGFLEGLDGLPVEGAVDLRFRIYPTLQGGSVLWDEQHQDVSVRAGVFAVVLGQTVPLSFAFDRQLFLGVTVNNDTEMRPRHQLTAVPYALMAREVEIDADALGTLACGDGQIAKQSGGQWQCAADLDTNTDTLGALACAAGQIAKRVDGQWRCAADLDTNTDTLGALACAAGQIAKRVDGQWRCAADLDTNTDTLGALACAAGQIAKRVDGQWRCAADLDTNTDTLGALACAAGQIAKRVDGQWRCAADLDTDTDTLAALVCAEGQIAKRVGGQWRCADDVLDPAIPGLLGSYVGQGEELCGNGSTRSGAYTVTVETQVENTMTGSFVFAAEGAQAVELRGSWRVVATPGGAMLGMAATETAMGGTVLGTGVATFGGVFGDERIDSQILSDGGRTRGLCVLTGSADSGGGQ